MPQFNLPKKHVSTVQLWTSLLLIVLAFVFSMSPIITLDVFSNLEDDNMSEAFEELDLDELLAELDLDPDFFEDYEELEVSSPKLIHSIMLFVKLVRAAAADEDDREEMFEDFKDYLDSEEGEEAIATALGLGLAIMNTLDLDAIMGDGDDGEGSENEMDGIAAMVNMIFGTLISMIGLFAVIFMTLFLPIIFGIMALASLITALKNIKTPENAAPALASKLPGKIALPFTIMLFQCVVPGMTYASGVVSITVLVIIATVLNLAATRMRTYEAEDFKYLNIVQGCSLVGIIGFLIFFFNIIKTGVFKAFLNGEFFTCLIGALLAEELDYDAEMGFIVCGVLMLVYLVIVLNSRDYIVKSTRRLSCAVKRDRVGFKKIFTDNHIVRAIFTLAAFIIPTYILGKEYEFEDIFPDGADGLTTATEEFTFLDAMKSSGERALSTALIGIIIMIVAEVAVIVLKKIFCSHITADKAEEILIGAAPTVETSSFVYFAKKANKVEAEATETAEATDDEPIEFPDEAPAEEAAEEATEEVAEEATEEATVEASSSDDIVVG